MFETYTVEARRVTTRAVAEGRRLGHDHLGTEHLLLALLDAEHGDTARVLRDAGADRRRIVQGLGGTGPAGRASAPRRWRRAPAGARVTESAQAVFARSRDASGRDPV